MICFNCGYRLPDTVADGCSLCGMKMPIACPTCKSPNPRHAIHCLACGHVLATVEQGAWNPDAGLSSGEALEESRRNVAVLFADVSGFTALSEVLDPEEVRSIINDCFQTITRPVYELEGSIDKYIGDCVMVLFGARVPHADDARRSVSCALRMQTLMESFSQERLSGKGLQLRLSIGVHFGLVVTGSVGNYYDKDYTVMGDTVNLAQRLQSAAPAGTVLVSRSVFEETKESFQYRDMGELTVRNRKEPVGSYRPESESLLTDSEQVLLLERDEILESANFLVDAMHAGRLVEYHVSGESGYGKTALSHALVRMLQGYASASLKVTTVTCGTTDRGRPHSLLSALLHAIMNIEVSGNPTAKRYRVVSYCFFLFPERPDSEVEHLADFLGIFMGLERSSDLQDVLNAMNPQDLERELIDQLQMFFRLVLIHRPSLLVLDGLQWADDRSIVLLEALLPGLTGIGSIWLFLHRQDKRLAHAPWRETPPESVMQDSGNGRIRIYRMLAPLSENGSARLAAQLLGMLDIDDLFREALLRIAQGNPLFIREFVTAVSRRGGYAEEDGIACLRNKQGIDLAKGIGNIILANFQDLPPDTVAVLQAASAIGSTFQLAWMRELASVVDPEKALEPAVRAGIVSVGTIHAGSGALRKEISFVHDMAREVLYESLLRSRRLALHAKIAAHLEKLAGQGETDVPALLGIQFEKAGNKGRAARYAYRAAVLYRSEYDLPAARAQSVRFLLLLGFSLPDAVSFTIGETPVEPVRNVQMEEDTAWGNRQEVGRLLGADGSAMVGAVLRALSEHARSAGYGGASLLLLRQALVWSGALRERWELRLSMADVMRESGLYDEALALLAELEPSLGGDIGLHGRLLLSRCTLFRMKMEPSALEMAKAAERMLKKAKDYKSLTETMSQMAGIHFSRGEPARAKLVLARALGYAERSRDLSSMARISGNLGILHLAEGDVASARSVFARAVELAAKVGNLHSLLSSQINLGILNMEQGRFERAEALLLDVVNRSTRASLKYQTCLAWLNLADLSAERGLLDDADARYAKAHELAGLLALSCEEALCDVGRARVLLRRVDSDGTGGRNAELIREASSLLTEALPRLREAEESVGISDCIRYQAEVSMKRSLEGGVPLAARIAEKNQPMNLDEAVALAENALQIATEAGNGMRRVKALRLLGFLSELSGRTEKALQQMELSVREAERLESELEAAKSAFHLSALHHGMAQEEKAVEWFRLAKEHAADVDACPWRERILGLS